MKKSSKLNSDDSFSQNCAQKQGDNRHSSFVNLVQSFPVILKREIRYFENIVDSIFEIYNHPIFYESEFTFSHKQFFLFSNLFLKHNSAL